MASLRIVKTKISSQPLPQFPSIPVVLRINIFVFYTSPKPFDKHIIQGTSSSVHADPDPSFRQTADVLVTRELRSLIGIRYARFPVVLQCLTQRHHAEAGLQGVRQFPCQYPESVTGNPVTWFLSG